MVKILTGCNNLTLISTNFEIKENNFYPKIMLTKSKPASVSPPAASTPTTKNLTLAVAPPQPVPESAPAIAGALVGEHDVYGQAASNIVAGNNLESTIQQILDMVGGSWDQDTVVCALRAAFNNPEKAIEYLYSGIPEKQQTLLPTGGPNANPLDLFPQGLPSMGSNASTDTLDILRNSQQFHALRAMVQELVKQNPQLMWLIQEHQADFYTSWLHQCQSVMVTPEEQRAMVLEVFFTCNKNKELAANYLLDHMHEFDEL
ncbi:hypothetical protein UlMin_008978 [Ulmus minor]